ncbi:hypothetical protein [Herbidospora cretacea]|uniref:hypothetical protein n=1 Tax=Herbidospora cretacea TaxID=28444 RepID=UPI0004C43991|nr:hypothetical protein [Herbidospora cretacea]
MTTVNWEREPGEKVEEFVAALLLLKHPHGNRITPSRGDRGVDLRVWNPDGYDIYQVKRYSRPLTATQATSVENSWNTFITQSLPVLQVRSWTLVTPWEPTNERLDWLERLTTGHGIHTHWMGGITLDGLAADNPALVEYYFGDGGQRLARLMADALQGGREVPEGVPGEDLLQAIITRQRSLATALNTVDPFYRYEVQIRAGHVRDQAWDADLRSPVPVAWVHYRQLDEQSYLLMRLLPRCAESPRLRPITASVQLEVPAGSPEQQAVEDWLRYGAPFHDVPGTVTSLTGPPGLLSAPGPGRFSFMVPAGAGDDRPDLEIRLMTADNQVAHTLDLIDVRISRGVDGPGTWLSGTDRSGVLEFQFRLNASDRDQVRMTLSSLVGKTPADVLPAIQLVADLPAATGLVLAVRGGRPLTSLWRPDESEVRASPLPDMARWTAGLLEALITVQAHTFHRVMIPDLDETAPERISALIQLGRLLRGEEVRTTWSEIIMTRGASDVPPPADPEFSVLLTNEVQVDLGDRRIVLDDVQRRVLYHHVRPADPHEFASAQPGDSIHLVPGSSAEATIAVVSISPSPG